MKLRKYTLEQLQDAIKTSVSVRQTLRKLKVKEAGGNYYEFHKAVQRFSLDTSHFTGQNLQGRKLPPRRRPLTEYLTKNSAIQSNELRRYLIQQGLLKPSCSNCGKTSWLRQPIPLELDHLDGNHQNNELSNLRLLCPNCHALTPTYRGKNITPKA